MIAFDVPFFPPTTNKAYFAKCGKLRLSRVGLAFKNEVTAFLVRKYPAQLVFFKKNSPYLIYLRLHTETVENKGWPKKTDCRYKMFDSTNRIKLIEDALVDATGVDDSHHIAFLVEKRAVLPGVDEHIQIFAWNLEEEVTPLDAFARL